MKLNIIHIVFSLYLLLPFRSENLAEHQTRIFGIVCDENNSPLPEVNVYIINSNEGTTTNDKGEFSFTTSLKGELITTASMIGYSKFEQRIYLIGQKEVELQIQLVRETIPLQESIVVGSSFGSEKSKGIVLNSQDVYITPGGAADIFQSLKTLPGLTQVSESAQLFIRGGDPIESLTLLDGATLYHPYTYESAYGGLFSNLNTSTISNLYFSSGGFSAKYGNTLSGILEIETKNEPVTTNFLIGISMAAVSINGEIPIIEERLGIRFTSQKSFTKPIMWLNGASDEFTTSPTSSNMSLAIISRYSKSGMIKLFGLYAEDLQGVNVERAEYDGVFNGNSNNSFVNLRHIDIINPNLLIKNSISFNRYSNHLKLGVLDYQKTDVVIKLRSDIEYQISTSTKLVAGLEFEQRIQDYLGIVPHYDHDIRPNALSREIDAEINNYRVAGYTELEFKGFLGIEKLFSVTGLRLDAFPLFKIYSFDPRTGIGYKITDNSTIKIAAGIFHQLPDLRLFSPQDGNPYLNSMEAAHLVVSFDFKMNELNSLRVEAYHKKYSNLPLEATLSNYNNEGNGFANGIDIIAKGSLPIGLEGWISYGYLNTKRRWMEFENLSKSNFDITHNLAVVLTYGLSEAWKVGISYKYATGRPYTPVIESKYISNENIFEPVYGNDNSARYPAYHRLDIRITHLTQIFRIFYSVFYIEALNILGIKNLFGFSYNRDYSRKNKIISYFGRETIVLGAQISF
jgi:hypothetical protein